MDIVYVLIPLSVVLVFLIGAVLYWAIVRGQFDELEGQGESILLDETGSVDADQTSRDGRR
jgi:cbb3-type cytochrome oxidase maturation protein